MWRQKKKATNHGLKTQKGTLIQTFEMIKINYQQNEPNKISFNLFSKVSMKFPNL